jgi:hypothetical protein
VRAEAPTHVGRIAQIIAVRPAVIDNARGVGAVHRFFGGDLKGLIEGAVGGPDAQGGVENQQRFAHRINDVQGVVLNILNQWLRIHQQHPLVRFQPRNPALRTRPRLGRSAEVSDHGRDVVPAPRLVGARHESPASLLGFGFGVEDLVDFLLG